MIGIKGSQELESIDIKHDDINVFLFDLSTHIQSFFICHY